MVSMLIPMTLSMFLLDTQTYDQPMNVTGYMGRLPTPRANETNFLMTVYLLLSLLTGIPGKQLLEKF